jgi:hypothetical protein
VGDLQHGQRRHAESAHEQRLASNDSDLGLPPGTPHLFRIAWSPAQVQYYVDARCSSRTRSRLGADARAGERPTPEPAP